MTVNEELLPNSETQDNTDPWQSAFEALDQTSQETTETDDESVGEQSEPAGTDTPAESNDTSTDTNQTQTMDSSQPEEQLRGLDNLRGEDTSEIARSQEELFHFSEQEIKEYTSNIQEQIRTKTLADIAEDYIRQGVRHNNGVLGANIEDDDITVRDEDGVPHFFNPDTGREFSGDNPRKQAQEWVDDYNADLEKQFNKDCQSYANNLIKEQGAGLAVIEFAPKYEALDDMRKAMFESIIQDYEILDNDGDVVGYSCNLEKALAAVNRQVATIQSRFKGVAPQKTTSPATDMKSTRSASKEDKIPEFKSIAEALEYEQNKLLNSMKGKK